MDVGKFSTADIGPYAVDGPFLALLAERLMEIAHRHHAKMAELTVDVEVSNGPYGRVERRHQSITPLLDGTFARQPQKVGIMVHGHAPCGSGNQSFVMSLALEPDSGGFMMATGPAALAQEGFETLRGAMAAAAKLAEEEGSAKTLPPGVAQAYQKMCDHLRLHETLDILRIAVPAAIVAALYAWGLFGPKRDAAFCLILGASFALLALSQYIGLTDRRKARRRRVADAAEAAGLPSPVPRHGPRRTVDLSRAQASDAARLSHDPLIPLNV